MIPDFVLGMQWPRRDLNMDVTSKSWRFDLCTYKKKDQHLWPLNVTTLSPCLEKHYFLFKCILRVHFTCKNFKMFFFNVLSVLKVILIYFQIKNTILNKRWAVFGSICFCVLKVLWKNLIFFIFLLTLN